MIKILWLVEPMMRVRRRSIDSFHADLDRLVQLANGGVGVKRKKAPHGQNHLWVRGTSGKHSKKLMCVNLIISNFKNPKCLLLANHSNYCEFDIQT